MLLTFLSWTGTKSSLAALGVAQKPKLIILENVAHTASDTVIQQKLGTMVYPGFFRQPS